MCKIPFYKRHIGLQEQDIEYMLNYLGFNSLDQFSDNALPDSIKSLEPLDLPTALSEDEALELIDEIIAKNTLKKSFIGQGYHGSFTPPVIQRNLFENPAWYTSYTPYQAEISQGRLELLFHFQTLVAELTGLPIANASLLDEATAIAEAMALAVRYFKGKRTNIAIGGILHPQNKAVLLTRAKHKNYNIVEYARQTDLAALIVPLMDSYGAIWNYSSIIEETKKTGALIIFVADPLALTIAKNVAKQGADIAVGSMQRFGIAMGFGGPSAAYMAVQEKLTRLMPGRIIGLSKDTQNNPAYRLALQTREQHIRRDKANSNICTSQALLANMSAAYAIWHGPQGLQNIALSVHHMACRFAAACKKAGLSLYSDKFFDCVTINIKGKAEYVKTKAYDSGILLRIIDENMISVNFDETSSEEDYKKLLAIFALNDSEQITEVKNQRDTEFLSQPIFNSINSETDMMRFLRALSDKDLALDRAMIPLGSCTMKMNAAAELMPLSNPKWSNIHPLATKDAEGYFELMEDLEELLCAITGLVKISFQPNSGAQGEFAGLLVIKEYLRSKKVSHRNICLIPASAHGTNPASAQMAGFEIVVVECAENGDIDIEDLKLKLQQYSENLAVLMVTYPSTHGVYEENIRDICDLVHGCGGQIYLDGANLNALIGLSKISDIGIDVCHMNLHKTFAIPHGGGGPGCGPIAVAEHLVKFLPSIELKDFMVSSAPYGSASLLVISWMYIRMMGAVGLKKASQCAILSANYVAKRLEEGNYKILYKGKNNFVAHEVIIDTRLLKEKFNITGEDVAKRLIDYGFHAPTMSFPVPGTLMIEPTESESKIELDRFCDAMISIYKEAENINNDIWLKDDNPLINAPHTAQEALLSEWKHCYSREIALYPSLYTKKFKYFPPVARIDNVTGDRNLVCGCVPINAYKKEV